MLYKLKTSKVFEKQKLEGKPTTEIAEEDPFAIQLMYWCPESRIFCVAGASAYVIIYRFSKHEVNAEISVSLHFSSICLSINVFIQSLIGCHGSYIPKDL